MRSIRTRLSVLLLAGTGCLLLLTGIALDRIVSHRLRAEFDLALLANARALMSLTFQLEDGIELEFDDSMMPAFDADLNPEYFELWLDDGTLLERSRSLDGEDLPRADVRLDEPSFADHPLPDGRRGRFVSVMFVPQVYDGDEDEADPSPADDDDDEPDPVFVSLADARSQGLRGAILVVARGRQPLERSVLALRLLIAAVLVVLLIGLTIWMRLALRLSLQPLDDVATQVGALDADRLDTRIRLREPPRELGAVVSQLNRLLDDLQEAFERERRFTGDVAHELRTPIAELRTLAEVGMQCADDPEAIRPFFADVRGATLQMEVIVSNLLGLARCDAGLQKVQNGRIELRRFVNDIWCRWESSATRKGLTFVNAIEPSLGVQSDPEKLERILSNLLSNAVAYGSTGARIECRAAQRNGAIRVSVSNPTTGLHRDDLNSVFERFWRKDDARSDGNHAGLGLSLVKAFAELLDLEVEVTLTLEGVFCIALDGLEAARDPIAASVR